MYTYTVWLKTKHDISNKQYWMTTKTKDELKNHLESLGNHDILVWAGNWFGLAPDNQPEPDYTYFS